jgi:hypothetical protein
MAGSIQNSIRRLCSLFPPNPTRVRNGDSNDDDVCGYHREQRPKKDGITHVFPPPSALPVPARTICSNSASGTFATQTSSWRCWDGLK